MEIKTLSVIINGEMKDLTIVGVYEDQDTLGNEFISYLTRIKDKEPNFYIFESAESQMTSINKVLGTLSIAIEALRYE